MPSAYVYVTQVSSRLVSYQYTVSYLVLDVVLSQFIGLVFIRHSIFNVIVDHMLPYTQSYGNMKWLLHDKRRCPKGALNHDVCVQ